MKFLKIMTSSCEEVDVKMRINVEDLINEEILFEVA